MSQKIIEFSLGLVPKSAGTYKSALQFRDALGSQIISLTDEQLAPEVNAKDRIKHYFLPPTTLGIPKLVDIFDLWNSLKNATFINIHTPLRFHCIITLFINLIYGVEYAIIPHGSLDTKDRKHRVKLKWLWTNLIMRPFFQRCKHTIFSTTSEQAKVQSLYRVKNPVIIAWPLKNLPQDRQIVNGNFRKNLNIPNNISLYLYLGRLHSMKKPFEILKSFEKANINNGILIIMGPDGDIRGKTLRDYVKDKQLKNIKILDPVYGKQKYEVIQASDFFISLSERENFGYSCAESMSYGVIPILSEGNDIRSLLNESDHYYLIKSNDSAALTNLIKYTSLLSTTDKLRKKTSLINLSRQYFQWEIFTKKIRKVCYNED